MEIGKKN
ncbi:hypothetical protein OIU78_025773 [Salix suchowensis]|nr:hypothetical protein OIU78_025773 [Salix suchowensis]